MNMRARRKFHPMWVLGAILVAAAVTALLTGCSSIGPGPAITPVSATHTIHVDRYRAEGDSILRILDEKRGSQSRDRGQLIREAAMDGKIPRVKGCIPHRAEIRGYQSPDPVTFLVNGRNAVLVAPQFGILTIPVDVCDGEGTITLDPGLVREPMALYVIGPPGIYPRNGLLRTCTRKEILQKRPWCGPLKGDPDVRWGEFYFLTHTYLHSHYHMVE